MSHLALCCWIKETRGRNSQTDTRLSRLNKHAEKNLIRPKKSVWKWHRRNPIFPFWLVQKGDWERERDKTVHAISGWRERGGSVWGEVGGRLRGGRGGSGGSPFLMLKVIRLLLACPRGVFYLESGLGLNKFWDGKWINTRHSAFSLSCKLQKSNKLGIIMTHTHI